MNKDNWPTRFPPGSREEHAYLLQHSEPVESATIARSTGERFLVLRTQGLYQLAQAVEQHWPSIALAVEAVRQAVSNGKPLVVSAQVRRDLGLTGRQARTALDKLCALPRWFAIEGRGKRRARAISPTPASISLLHRKPR